MELEITGFVQDGEVKFGSVNLIPDPDVLYASEIGVDQPDADDSELPANLQIELEVERRLLEHYKAGVERYRTFCHMTYMRMDVLRDKIAQIEMESSYARNR